MIYIDFEKSTFNKYHKIIKCWLLRKFDGGKSYKKGYSCGNNKCEICSTSIHKVKNLPKTAVDFFKKNIDALIIGNPYKIGQLYEEYKGLGINDEL